MLGLDKFTFAEIWSPISLLIYVIIAAAYILITGPYQSMLTDAEPTTWRRKSLFLVGLFLFYFAQAGPLDLLAHLVFSAHMIAMTVSYIIAPPLLILGIPAWIWRKLLSLRFLKPLKFMTHPVVSILLFNGLFSIYHMPAILDYVMVNFEIHILLYIVLFITSMLMWWPIVCPVPEWDRMGELRKMAYIFIAGFLLTPACALIIFSPTSLYETYTNPAVWAVALQYCIPGDPAKFLELYEGPQNFTRFTQIQHQQIGGISMKLIQEFLYISILAWVFRNWFRKERARNQEMDEEAVIMEWRKRMNQA